MPGIRLSILCATLILFQNVKGSRGMDPTSSENHTEEARAVLEAENYLITTSKNLGKLDKERLEAIKKLHSTSNPSERQFYQTLAERLERSRDKAEGEYLSALKGYPFKAPAVIYVSDSEEANIRQALGRGALLPPTPMNIKKEALTSPSIKLPTHAQIFRQAEGGIDFQNYVRLHHDRTRVRLENLEKAYKHQAKVHSLSARETPFVEALYENHITREKERLKTALEKQREVLRLNAEAPYFQPEERKRTKEIMKEELFKHGLSYKNFHGKSLRTRRNIIKRDRAPPHAPKLRYPEDVLFPQEHGYTAFKNINEALEKSLDDIDVLSHELSVARALKIKMTNPVAKVLYGESTKRLKDRIEIIRRYQDNIASGRMDEIPRTRYIPGSEREWLKHAFTCNHLNWDQEHAHIG